jgi:excinuclease ABC subunit C
MGEAAKRLDFERAARLRDAIAGMDGLKGRQSVVGTTGENLDVVALTAPTEEGSVAAVGLVKVRAGQVVGAESRILSMPPDMGFSREDLLSVFLLQDYALRRELPPILYLSSQEAPGMRAEGAPGVALEGSLACLAEKGVTTRYAVSGRPRSLLSLAESTGRARLATTGTPRDEALLEETQRFLSLPQTPRHIEGVDISILQGTEAVGSLVVFRDGRPAKPEYRRYKIKGVPGMNDFAMVHEVVRRRLSRLKAEGGEMPDLLLIDGGAGQVAAAASALEPLELTSLPLIGLAKRQEEVYLPGRKEPLRGDKNGRPLLLLRHVRDEAHRFAITYHRKRRQMALRTEKAL